jgi:hypothetical protein
MHAAALGEGLAVDPDENVATLLVDAEPPRRSIEASPFQVQKNVSIVKKSQATMLPACARKNSRQLGPPTRRGAGLRPA